MNRKSGFLLTTLALALGCSETTSLKNGGSGGIASPDAAAGASGEGGASGSGTGGRTAGTAATGGATNTGGTTSTASAGTTISTAGTTGTGGLTSTGGSSVVGGATSSSAGGRATGGTSTGKGGTAGGASDGGVAGTTVLGGTSAGSGGNATGGMTVRGGGGTAAGGQAGTTLAGGGSTATGGQTTNTAPANDSPGQDPFVRPAGSGILITSSDGLNGIDLILAADASGGMFVTGATANPQAMGMTAFDPGVESEAFAARLDAQGKLVWSVPLKTCGVPAGIAAGPDNSVFVLCPYEPDATTLMPMTCDPAASVEKLSGSDGKVLFEARVNVPATPADGYMCPYGLGVDAQGRSYVGGGYSPAAPTSRALLTAVTAAGQQDWTLISDGPASSPTSDSAVAYVNDVNVDSNGNVLLVGGFNTWMKLGSTQLTSQAVAGQSSMYNGFFARVPASGTDPTAWRFGGTVFDMATSLTPTADGGFVIGGWVSASSNIGGQTVTASQEGSAFVAQITSQGQATWAKTVPGIGMTDDVAVGLDGKVHMVGQFANDEILYTYDPASDTLTSRRTVAGNATDNGLRTHSVAVSTSGAVWLSGTFQGTINLGTGALSTSTVASFLIKLN